VPIGVDEGVIVVVEELVIKGETSNNGQKSSKNGKSM
jgi:hypothetical protein